MLEALSKGAGRKLKSLDLVYIRKRKIIPAFHDANAVLVIHRCILFVLLLLVILLGILSHTYVCYCSAQGEASFFMYIYIMV